jgi:hypothetical protein
LLTSVHVVITLRRIGNRNPNVCVYVFIHIACDFKVQLFRNFFLF